MPAICPTPTPTARTERVDVGCHASKFARVILESVDRLDD